MKNANQASRLRMENIQNAEMKGRWVQSQSHYQLKYLDVEGVRVFTNNRCVAEQIESDKSGERHDGWSTHWRIWTSWQMSTLEEHRDGVKIGTVGKFQN